MENRYGTSGFGWGKNIMRRNRSQKNMSVTPSMWIIWYEIFDNILGEMAKIKGVSNGVHQGVHL
jgi:hypothetical protein